MDPDLSILHLSDSHIGIPRNEIRSDQVFDHLFIDIKDITKKIPKPNLIIFSGDLVYGEKGESKISDQLIKANEFVIKVYESLGTTIKNTPIVIVPGNHDVNRETRDVAHDLYIEEIQNCQQIYDDMTSNNRTWKAIISRQQEWANFVEEIYNKNGQISLDKQINLSTGVISCGGKKIGVAGLNSSWAAYKDGQEAKLFIGKYQIDKALDLMKDCDFKLAISHHPISWLSTIEQNEISQTIEANFHIHLYGHQHNQWYIDANRHLKVEAGACYQGAKKEKAYSWTSINFNNQTCEIKFRKFEEKGEGGWVPYIIRGKTDNEGNGNIHNLFSPKGDQETTHSSGDETRLKYPTKKFSELESISELIEILKEYFSCRWEPYKFENKDLPINIYWPIRLRKANPIHAVQCFIAAGLQRKGAKVYLSLDDLGNIETSTDEFYSAINKWFIKGGGDFDKLIINNCSDIISASNDVWSLLQSWLSNTTVRMEDVLLISKLIGESEFNLKISEVLANKKPRRLMTPAVVWASLSAITQENEQSRYITLGGYDEQNLWKTGRERTSLFRNLFIGHLYIPKLLSPSNNNNKTFHMGDTSTIIEWDAEEDIKAALSIDNCNYTRKDFEESSRIIPWCLTGCVQLPSFLNDFDYFSYICTNGLSSIYQIDAEDLTTKIDFISKEIYKWILS